MARSRLCVCKVPLRHRNQFYSQLPLHFRNFSSGAAPPQSQQHRNGKRYEDELGEAGHAASWRCLRCAGAPNSALMNWSPFCTAAFCSRFALARA